jgi:hypothetical protein
VDRGGKVIALSDVTRDDKGLLAIDLAAMNSRDLVSVEVFRAFASQQFALSAVEMAVTKGKIAPANRAQFTRLALSDLAMFHDITKNMQQVDLTEHGIGDDGSGHDDENAVNSRIISLSAARAQKDGIPMGEAMKLVATENPDLITRWQGMALRNSNEASR